MRQRMSGGFETLLAEFCSMCKKASCCHSCKTSITAIVLNTMGNNPKGVDIA